MMNAFTVDLEDWYQGLGIPETEWNPFEKRIRVGTDKLLALLAKKNVKATFFTLGKVIEEHPDLISDIISAGHEMACHTHTHPALYTIDKGAFEKEIDICNRLLLEKFNLKNLGFRAPFFSVDKRSIWALDVLHEKDFLYDSSIFPGDNKRTGIVGYEKEIHVLENGLIEVPLTTFKVLKYDAGLGGAYFRILPYIYFKQQLRKINRSGKAGIFYIHPWELDPTHPFLKNLPARIRYPHYFNLKSTERKIDKLLSDFKFTTMLSMVQEFKK